MKGKTALITGSSKRIGKELALHLAKQSWNLALHYNTSKGEALALRDYLKAIYPKQVFKVFCCNLSDEIACESLISEVNEEFGQIDLLINNAGIQPQSFIEGDHVWQRVGNHVYTLIDASTGDPFLRNMNLLSGTEVTPSLFPVNKQNAEAEIEDIRTNYDNEFWQVDLALRGYDLDLIITNLENAETQQEFDELLANFKKLTC